MNDIKWYFIALTTMIGLIIGGQAISEWRSMDCRMTLAQAGRSPADIREICK